MTIPNALFHNTHANERRSIRFSLPVSYIPVSWKKKMVNYVELKILNFDFALKHA